MEVQPCVWVLLPHLASLPGKEPCVPQFPLGAPGKLSSEVGEALHQVCASVSPSPSLPSPARPQHHVVLNTMHTPWTKLFLRQGKYNPISMKCHHLPHPLTRSLSDGVFKVFLPRPWPDWAPTSPVETSPCGLMVLWCRWAAADGVGQCHPGLSALPGWKRVLGHFCKKNPTPQKGCQNRSQLGWEGLGKPLCPGRTGQALAWLRRSHR